jgi:hypothetical protein
VRFVVMLHVMVLHIVVLAAIVRAIAPRLFELVATVASPAAVFAITLNRILKLGLSLINAPFAARAPLVPVVPVVGACGKCRPN